MKLYRGDCLEVMDELITNGVKVDAIICDPPYEITACKWDSVIPFDAMWARINKLVKDDGAVVLFGKEPFSSALRLSNIKHYKYDWIWNKVSTSSGIFANKRPMSVHEIISVFYKKQCTYNPQKQKGKKWARGGNKRKSTILLGRQGIVGKNKSDTDCYKFPKTIITFSNANKMNKLHPTQKPVALIEYLVKTYTNPGDTVLDFTMGSGTTGLACKKTGRKFIGIELDEKYFNIAKQRIDTEIVQHEFIFTSN